MTDGFGIRKARRKLLWPVLISVAVSVIVAGVTAYSLYIRATEKAAELKVAAYWTPTGPPCPVAAKSASAPGVTLAKGFEFAGVTFRRAYGDASCREFHSRVRDTVGGAVVCQFTGPSVLQVTTDSGDAYFSLGGQRATVAVKDGHARCVMAANYVPSVQDN